MRKARAVLMLVAVSTAVACVPRREPPPPAPMREPTIPPPVRTPPPPPPPADWRDIPLSRGGWVYRAEGQGSVALFGPAAGETAFLVRCDRAGRQITLIRQGTSTGNMMTVRTSSGARNFPLSVQAEPTPNVSASLAANDRFLDGIAFSRGRFTVEVPGAPMLVIPAWPEPARVVEDCRS